MTKEELLQKFEEEISRCIEEIVDWDDNGTYSKYIARFFVEDDGDLFCEIEREGNLKTPDAVEIYRCPFKNLWEEFSWRDIGFAVLTHFGIEDINATIFLNTLIELDMDCLEELYDIFGAECIDDELFEIAKSMRKKYINGAKEVLSRTIENTNLLQKVNQFLE